MDFDLTDEQRLLKESVDRLVADRYGFEDRRRYAQEPEGFSRALWEQYAELGLLGLPFAEEHGGFGGGAVETMIVMEAFGRALALEPYLATVILGGGFLRHGASEAQRAELIPRIAAGELTLAFAHTERQSRHDLFDVLTTAKRDGSGYVLEGEKGVVVHGDSAQTLVVTARTAGATARPPTASRSSSSTRTPPGCRGGATRRRTGSAPRRSRSRMSASAQEAVIGPPDDALPLVERVVDEAIAALCAEAVGAMGEMHRLTIEYLKTRKQFGVPIGSFQALQHRGADMFVALEQARSMAMFATMMAQEDNAAERRKAASAAKVQIGRSGRFIGQQAVQLHGGVGMTMEFSVGHYFKRVTMIDTLFGDADHHLALVAEAGGLV